MKQVRHSLSIMSFSANIRLNYYQKLFILAYWRSIKVDDFYLYFTPYGDTDVIIYINSSHNMKECSISNISQFLITLLFPISVILNETKWLNYQVSSIVLKQMWWRTILMFDQTKLKKFQFRISSQNEETRDQPELKMI